MTIDKVFIVDKYLSLRIILIGNISSFPRSQKNNEHLTLECYFIASTIIVTNPSGMGMFLNVT